MRISPSRGVPVALKRPETTKLLLPRPSPRGRIASAAYGASSMRKTGAPGVAAAEKPRIDVRRGGAAGAGGAASPRGWWRRARTGSPGWCPRGTGRCRRSPAWRRRPGKASVRVVDSLMSNDTWKASSLKVIPEFDLGPRPEPRDLQRRILRRQRTGAGDRVDPGRIRLEAARDSGERSQRQLGRAPQPKGAQLDVARHRRWTQQLRQRALRLPAEGVHLKQAIARVHDALQVDDIRLEGGEDVRDAEVVATTSPPRPRQPPDPAGARSGPASASRPAPNTRWQRAPRQGTDGKAAWSLELLVHESARRPRAHPQYGARPRSDQADGSIRPVMQTRTGALRPAASQAPGRDGRLRAAGSSLTP